MVFRKIRENGEGGIPEQKKGIFYYVIFILLLFNYSRISRLLSDKIHGNKTMINITVTLPNSLILNYAFYRMGMLLYESMK